MASLLHIESFNEGSHPTTPEKLLAEFMSQGSKCLPKNNRKTPRLYSTILLEGIALLAILGVARPELAIHILRDVGKHVEQKSTQPASDSSADTQDKLPEKPTPHSTSYPNDSRQAPAQEFATTSPSPLPGFYPRMNERFLSPHSLMQKERNRNQLPHHYTPWP